MRKIRYLRLTGRQRRLTWLVLAVLLAFGTPIKSLITKLWAKKKA